MPSEAGSRFSVEGLTAVVTGACGVLGSAVVADFCASGARVIGLDLDPETATLGDRLPGSIGVPVDVTDEAAVARALDEHAPHGVDILVNNAGINARATPFDVDMATWDHIMAVNLRGYFLVARGIAARAIAAGRAVAMVNVSSTAAGPSLGRGNLAYALSKAAGNQLTRELAVEWAASGIRVNAVQPAQIDTPGWAAASQDPEMEDVYRRVIAGIPMRRLVTVDDLVGAIVFLSSPASSGITGTVLPVDGGNMALNAAGTVGPPVSVRSSESNDPRTNDQ